MDPNRTVDFYVDYTACTTNGALWPGDFLTDME